jgi:stage III sporulation protein AG
VVIFMSEPKGIIEQWWERLKNNKEWNLARSPGMWKLILILAGGLFLLIYAGSWVSPKEKSSISPGYQAAEKKGEECLSTAEKELERRLEGVLSSIAGSGDVQVTITMAAGPEYLYAKNLSEQTRTVEEKDQSGGNRTTTEANEEENLVLLQTVSGGKEEPVLIRAKRPEIAGVLVLAEGARDPGLREELVQAVITVLAVPAHKVTVLSKEGG